jgi:tetratricopeptide (TPR) repeat protein
LSDGQANVRLADLMREAGLTRKGLARGVRDVSAAHGEPIGPDHTAVTRWLGGQQPRGRTPEFIAEAIGRKLGRRLTPADVGMAGQLDPHLGLDYADDPAALVVLLPELWRADLAETSHLLRAPTDTAAWSEAALGWLIHGQPDKLAERPSGRLVGESDVAAFKLTTATFAQLDNQFGGGHARRALIHYLATEAASLLAGRYSEKTGRLLYAAVAEAMLLAGWSSYDAGHHALAQRYLIQALRLAQAGEDVLLAGSILDAMSHQATFIGQYRPAANLAETALTGTAGRATPTLTAHFHTMAARAHSAAGDARSADRALSEAVAVFERRRPDDDDPDWITYFDEIELNAELAHCSRDLSRAEKAVQYATTALAGAGASERSDFFVTMVRADGHLSDDNLEQACATVQEALPGTDQLKSARSVRYLRDFRRRLLPHARHPAVVELAECGVAHPIWAKAEPGSRRLAPSPTALTPAEDAEVVQMQGTMELWSVASSTW